MDGGVIKDYSELIKGNTSSAYAYVDLVSLWNSPDRGFLIIILWIVFLLMAFLLYTSIRRGDLNKKANSIKNTKLRIIVIALLSVVTIILTFIVFSSSSFNRIFENFLYSL
jgi:heme/copper-type cytochrome/quinol oxidase subunit 2